MINKQDKRLIVNRQKIMANTCLYVLAILWFCSFYAYANTTVNKRHYQFIDMSLANILIDVAKTNNRQLIMQSYEQLNAKITFKCHCTLEQVLTQLLTNSQFTFELPLSGSLLIFEQKKKNTNPVTREAHENYEHILVTGYANPNRSILRSSSAVTVFDRFDFTNEGKPTTAQMLKHVPGFWVEDSGGEVNNNVSPRGLRGGEGYRFISLMEDGLPVTYDGIWADFFIRQDLMIDKVETIRGGNSGIISVNGPAAAINFISMLPSTHNENRLSYSLGLNYHYNRLDFSYSPKLDTDWQYVVGGFYRHSSGLKDPGYTGDHGGQLKVVAEKKDAISQAKVVLKYLNDTTIFYSPVVMQGRNNPKGVSGLPASTGTLLSEEFGNFLYRYPKGAHHSTTKTFDIRDGQQTNLISAGFFYDLHITPSWLLTLKTRYSDMSNSMLALLNLGDNSILNAKDYLNSLSSSSIKAELIASSSGEAIQDLENINGNGLLMLTYPLYSQYRQQLWVNKLELDWQYQDLSVNFGGSYVQGQYDELPLDKWLGTFLIDVAHQPRRFDIKLTDIASGTQQWLTEQSALDYQGPAYLSGEGSFKSMSLYSTVNVALSEQLLLDLGIRQEWLSLQSSSQTDAIYQNEHYQGAINYLSGYTFTEEKNFDELAWSIGFNWKVNDDLTLYGHFANAFEMPRLSSYANAIGWGDYTDSVPQEVSFEQSVRLKFHELGLRYATENFAVTATLFETRFDPLLFSVYQGQNSHTSILIDTKTKGLELEFNANLGTNVTIEGHGVWQNAHFTGIPNSYTESRLNGNQLTRTPEKQLSLKLQYDWQELSSFASVHYVGTRYSDIENSFLLPSYSTLNLGITWSFSPEITLQLVAKNINNTVGLTEGNPRNNNESKESSYYFARPILGRSVKAHFEFIF